MKKFLVKAVCICAAVLAFGSCSGKKKTGIRVAMVTDSGDITDQSFNQSTYTAAKEFCEAEENKLDFKYYKPSADSTEARVASINQAIQDDYNVIILPGFLFAEAIVKVAEDNPNVKFIGLDVSEYDLNAAANAGKPEAEWTNYPIPINVFCCVYQEEIPGFMAGYAAVKEGYKHLGFLGGLNVPAVIRYGFGFVQGVNAAAEEMGIADQVAVEYVYGGQFFGDPAITAQMDTWYSIKAVEVVFACGGGIWSSAAEAAKKVNGKLIGVDVDQSAQINAYNADSCVTSAMKGLGATVKSVLKSIKDGTFDGTYAGRNQNLGLVSDTEIENNYVQLPVDTWSMKSFTVEDYKALVADIYNGKIKISNDIEKDPVVSVKFTKYANIK